MPQTTTPVRPGPAARSSQRCWSAWRRTHHTASASGPLHDEVALIRDARLGALRVPEALGGGGATVRE